MWHANELIAICGCRWRDMRSAVDSGGGADECGAAKTNLQILALGIETKLRATRTSGQAKLAEMTSKLNGTRTTTNGPDVTARRPLRLINYQTQHVDYDTLHSAGSQVSETNSWSLLLLTIVLNILKRQDTKIWTHFIISSRFYSFTIYLWCDYGGRARFLTDKSPTWLALIESASGLFRTNE